MADTVDEGQEEGNRVRFMLDSDAPESDFDNDSTRGRLSSTDSLSSLTPDKDGTAIRQRPNSSDSMCSTPTDDSPPQDNHMTDEEYERSIRYHTDWLIYLMNDQFTCM